MIFRIWHGWAPQHNADRYEALLRTEMLPGIHRVAGYQGAYLLRRPDGHEVEFVTITVFDDLDAVKRFAGEDYETPVLHPEAKNLLSRWDQRSLHYDTLMTPEQVREAAAAQHVLPPDNPR